ncbi:MAG: manganese efflux pump MntP family protein [Bacillota bacterium]|jgi:putative Mn2+ efflux pump MntP
MTLTELFIIAVALSMDAFAVAVGKGLSLQSINIKKAALIGVYFGLFQCLMPLVGYTLGVRFQDKIMAIDHWVAFALLLFIGINMIRESRSKEKNIDGSLGCRSMLLLAVATSIDALAVGVSFAFLQVKIFFAVIFIGIVTFFLSMLGVRIGNVFGLKYKSHAELAGGIILIIMGIKILLENLF